MKEHTARGQLCLCSVCSRGPESSTLGKSQSYMLLKGGKDGDADEGSPTTITHSLIVLDKLKCLYHIIFDREQNFEPDGFFWREGECMVCVLVNVCAYLCVGMHGWV